MVDSRFAVGCRFVLPSTTTQPSPAPATPAPGGSTGGNGGNAGGGGGTSPHPFTASSSPAGSEAHYGSQHNGGASNAKGPVKSEGGKDVQGSNQNYQDASPNPTGASHGGRDPRREPHASWSGDLDPKSRSLQGTVTIRPGPDARKLTAWKLYPTGDGSHANRKELKFADGTGPGGQNHQYSHSIANPCGASCVNNSPYSPKCSDGCTETKTMVAHDGTRASVTREKITILPGDGGEFYISRVQNQICEYGSDYNPAGMYSFIIIRQICIFSL